jgi:hypothetical protein
MAADRSIAVELAGFRTARQLHMARAILLARAQTSARLPSATR